MGDLLDKGMVVIIVVFTLFVLMLVLMFPMTMYGEYQKCQIMQETGQEYNYKWFLSGGCMVQIESGLWYSIGDTQRIDGNIELIKGE